MKLVALPLALVAFVSSAPFLARMGERTYGIAPMDADRRALRLGIGDTEGA